MVRAVYYIVKHGRHIDFSYNPLIQQEIEAEHCP